MRVKITKKILKLFCVFRVSSKNKVFINKKFNVLHEQRKLEWATKLTPYAFSVFVVWHTVQIQGEAVHKGRVVVNIRGLNKVSEFDVYSMFLQSDIISRLQDSKFISIMDCAAFFHQ